MTRDLLVNACIKGFSLYEGRYADSERILSDREQAVAAEIENYYRKAKEIISANWDFFEKLASALAEKKLLSAVDIQNIKRECRIVSVAV